LGIFWERNPEANLHRLFNGEFSDDLGISFSKSPWIYQASYLAFFIDCVTQEDEGFLTGL
jgi:hypothetical protein